MSYIDSQLLPNEKVLYRSQLHWKIFILPVCVSLLCDLGAIAVLTAGGVSSGAVFLLIVGGLIMIPAVLKRAGSEFSVTNKRIVVKLGFFTTRSVELLHSKVEAISVNQGMMGKLLGFGDIVVTGSGGTREVFNEVGSPLELRRAVQAATTSSI